jgi:hypothetical protein
VIDADGLLAYNPVAFLQLTKNHFDSAHFRRIRTFIGKKWNSGWINSKNCRTFVLDCVVVMKDSTYIFQDGKCFENTTNPSLTAGNQRFFDTELLLVCGTNYTPQSGYFRCLHSRFNSRFGATRNGNTVFFVASTIII